MDDPNQKSAQNYELLIRVDEQLKNLTREVRDMHTNVDQRVAILEKTKMDTTDAIERFGDITKVTDTQSKDIAALKLQAAQFKTMMKTWGTAAVVILGGLQIFQMIISITK